MVTFCDTCMNVQLATCECCITAQTLVNAIRTYEACVPFIDDARIMDVSGKDCIGGGNTTGITITLQNCWNVRAFCGYACQTNVIIRESQYPATKQTIVQHMFAVAVAADTVPVIVSQAAT